MALRIPWLVLFHFLTLEAFNVSYSQLHFWFEHKVHDGWIIDTMEDVQMISCAKACHSMSDCDGLALSPLEEETESFRRTCLLLRKVDELDCEDEDCTKEGFQVYLKKKPLSTSTELPTTTTTMATSTTTLTPTTEKETITTEVPATTSTMEIETTKTEATTKTTLKTTTTTEATSSTTEEHATTTTTQTPKTSTTTETSVTTTTEMPTTTTEAQTSTLPATESPTTTTTTAEVLTTTKVAATTETATTTTEAATTTTEAATTTTEAATKTKEDPPKDETFECKTPTKSIVCTEPKTKYTNFGLKSTAALFGNENLEVQCKSYMEEVVESESNKEPSAPFGKVFKCGENEIITGIELCWEAKLEYLAPFCTKLKDGYKLKVVDKKISNSKAEPKEAICGSDYVMISLELEQSGSDIKVTVGCGKVEKA